MRRDEQEALARACSARAAAFRRWMGGNEYKHAAWNSAVMDKPYAVYLADEAGVFRTMAFDFDGKGAEEDAREFLGELKSLSIPAIFCESGSGEGRHVIFTVPAGIDAETVRDLAYGVGKRLGTLDKSMLCNPKAGAIRPPGAPHREGGESVLVGCSVFEALEILEEGTTPERVRMLAARFPWQRLAPVAPLPNPSATFARIPDRARARMRSGVNGTVDGTRSGLIMSLACSYVLAGASRRQFALDLLSPANKAGEKLREMDLRNPLAARRWLLKTWEKAREYMAVDSRPPRQNLSGEEKVLGRIVLGSDLKGKKGLTDRIVLAAHGAVAFNVGSTVYQASDRQLAERAGVSRQAVNRSHQRLIARGHLRRIEPGKEKEASLWQLLPPTGDQTDSHPLKESSSLASLSSPSAYAPLGCVLLGTEEDSPAQEVPIDWLLEGLGHDAFRHGGLGAGSLIVWACLNDQKPRTARSLRRQLGLSRNAIHTALKRLARHGLAEQTTDGWLGVNGDLDQVAEELGTSGRGASDERLHQDERDGYLDGYNRFVMDTEAPAREARQKVGRRKVERRAHESDRVSA